LKASIRAVGALTPIIVEYVQAKNSYDIVDGYTRYDILVELEHLEVDCLQIFTQDQRREALLANATRRQLSPDERRALLGKAQAAFADAHKSLIPELAALHQKGELVKCVGRENLLYLLNASHDKQREIFARYQVNFSQDAPSSKKEAALVDQVKKLTADLLVARSRQEQLQSNLDAATTAKESLENEVERLEQQMRDAETTSRKDDQVKGRLEKRIETLTAQIATLTTNRDDMARKNRVLEEQLKTAEAEVKAARIVAKEKERALQTATHRTSNPQIAISSFESIHRLCEAIHAQIIAAKPLDPEDQTLLQQQVLIAREKLNTIEQTLLTPGADIIPLQRHLKSRASVH
jgi:chaperonin cofactor prefoldin